MSDAFSDLQLLLALDTSGDICSVAVHSDGRLISEHTFRHGMHLSERLLEHVEAVLRDADTSLQHVSALAVGVGPGSFTGTRIGVMTAKTWAAVLQKPLYGIGSLDAIAFTYCGVGETYALPLLPCRAGIVFASLFDVAGAAPVALAPPTAVPLDELLVLLPIDSRPIVVCGNGIDRYQTELEALIAGANRPIFLGEARVPRAAHIASIAYQRQQRGDPGEEAMNLVPLYVSPPPISQPKPENRAVMAPVSSSS